MGYYDALDDTNYTDSVSKFRDFSTNQKQKILAANMARNGGSIKSDAADDTYVLLNGSAGQPNSPEIDHIHPKSKGGTNQYCNAQVEPQEEPTSP